ncbi:IclR family transcriptional regulator [Agromyces sp. SYSU T00266]|uniref:IclR family transcriptional regulator n=1 Tax=Agromyces zhanjiangensis TaxID=3158562 RepID=UPI0033960B92
MSSTLQAIAVLEMLAREQPVGLSDLARKMELPKSTVQRCIETLAIAGWVAMESPATKRWVVSIRPFAVAVTAIERGGLRDRALPVMNRLSAETDETIHLAVPDKREIVLVERVDSPHALRAVAPVGMRAPLHASSNGKAVLAASNDDELASYIEDGLSSITSHTMTAPADVLADIRAARVAGYAVSREELQDGVVSVASAIRDNSGRPVAALSLSAPRDRMPEKRVREVGPVMHAAAEEIGRQLAFGF